MPRRTTQTSSAKDFWMMLKDPDYRVVHECRKAKTFNEFRHGVGGMLATVSKSRQDIFDKCFTMVLDAKLPPIDVIRIVSSWTVTYKFPMDPSKLGSFDRFHTKYGPLIVNKYNGKNFSKM